MLGLAGRDNVADLRVAACTFEGFLSIFRMCNICVVE